MVTIGADLSQVVGADKSTTVGGSDSQTVAVDRSTLIGHDEDLGVKGGRTIQVTGDESHRTDGVLRTLVGVARITAIGTEDQPGHEQLSVAGQCDIASSGKMRISSEQSLRLVCGASSITLLPDSIILSSPHVQVQGTSNVTLANLRDRPRQPPSSSMERQTATLAAGVVVCVGGGRPRKARRASILDEEAHPRSPVGQDQLRQAAQAAPRARRARARDPAAQGRVRRGCRRGSAPGGKKAGGGAPLMGVEDEMGNVTFTVSQDNIPSGTTTVTLFISTPDGTIVERECAPGGTVTLQGRKGATFTLVDMKIGTKSIPVTRAGYDPGAPND